MTEGCGVEMIVPASETSDSLSEGSGVDTLTMGDWTRGGVGTGVGSRLRSVAFCEVQVKKSDFRFIKYSYELNLPHIKRVNSKSKFC